MEPDTGSVRDSRVVLASGSPRRRRMLEQLGLTFEVRPADLDETPHAGEDPIAYVVRLACEKATAVAEALAHDPGGAPALVIAADTTVELDGEILGKPDDADDVRRMLRRLSARTHRVHTGLAIHDGVRLVHDVSTTEVRFVSLDDAMVEWYVGTEEPFDKAGAYALQGAGGMFVDHLSGSVSGVVGLPLSLLVQLSDRIRPGLFPHSTKSG